MKCFEGNLTNVAVLFFVAINSETMSRLYGFKVTGRKVQIALLIQLLLLEVIKGF